ncbi:MAG: protoporphyrinogen oxidase [Acidobacteriota bacterium]|nr:protoporphyrinogen oxidase [Acidobacteriota bacterium]MDQ7086424.1 protoporphyrinogen oxidase [Acidobacteriota bacterium]
MPRLVVVGGGISGLAAAVAARRRAEQAGRGLEVLVVEKDDRCGGKALTVAQDGYLFEGGPTGYLDNEPLLDELVRAVGLTPLPANDAAARRFIVRGGKLREVSANPLRFALSGLLSPFGMARVLAEPWIRPGKGDDEESIFDFAHRRLGREIAERMIAPMVLGVFAGDARQLSAAAAFPRLVELEQQHGSLIRALLALRRRRKLQGSPTGPAGKLTSFEGGLETLPQALATRGGVEVQTGAAVESLEAAEGVGYRLRIGGRAQSLEADAVVLAGECWAMAGLLEGLAPTAARILEAIPTPPVTVVALGYGPAMRGAVPVGFGALIPRGEDLRILGCLWDSHLFPGREPAGHLLMRVMLGGSADPQAAGLDDATMLAQVTGELRRLFPRLTEAPVFHRIVRWPRAIPQYEPGHLRRVEALRGDLARHPRLFVAGNALEGIAFTKAAAAGVRAGQAAAAQLLGLEATR